MGVRVLDRNKLIRKLYALGGPEAPRGSVPHLGQIELHGSSARFKTSVWGRRAGKSLGGATDIEPDVFSMHTDGFAPRIWIVAPNYDLGEREWRVIWHHLVNVLQLPMNYKYNRRKSGEMSLETAWGAQISVKSAERPDAGLLGEGLTKAIMAEAARHQRSTWDQYIEPALADRNGGGIFTSTPQGPNWLKLFFDRGKSDDHPDWASWQFPSWINTVRFPGGLRFVLLDEHDKPTSQEIPWRMVAADPRRRVAVHPASNPKLAQSWRTLSHHYFWQEYGAEFRTQAGRVYPDFDTGYHVKKCEFVRGRKNYRTIDFGTTNPFVCLDLQVDDYGRVYVWREWRRVGHTTVENAQWCLRPDQLGYELDGVVADPYDAEGRLSLENEWGIPAEFVTIGIKNGIEMVQRWLKFAPDPNDGPMAPRLFFDPSCYGAIEEFQAYKYKETLDEEAQTDQAFQLQDDKNPLEEPLKQNDHAPDALRNWFAWHYGSEFVHHAENSEAFNENEDESYEFEGAYSRRYAMSMDD